MPIIQLGDKTNGVRKHGFSHVNFNRNVWKVIQKKQLNEITSNLAESYDFIQKICFLLFSVNLLSCSLQNSCLVKCLGWS